MEKKHRTKNVVYNYALTVINTIRMTTNIKRFLPWLFPRNFVKIWLLRNPANYYYYYYKMYRLE